MIVVCSYMQGRPVQPSASLIPTSAPRFSSGATSTVWFSPAATTRAVVHLEYHWPSWFSFINRSTSHTEPL